MRRRWIEDQGLKKMMMKMRIARCQVIRKQLSKTPGHSTRLKRSFDSDLLARSTVLILHTVPLLCVQRSASDLEDKFVMTKRSTSAAVSSALTWQFSHHLLGCCTNRRRHHRSWQQCMLLPCSSTVWPPWL